MIGVILAAGMGTRLMPLTKEIPKALLKINGVTLLERMIKNCIDAGISKYIVVVGYNKNKVIDACHELADKYWIEINPMVNEEYDVTNTSVSTYIVVPSFNFTSFEKSLPLIYNLNRWSIYLTPSVLVSV